MTRIVHLTDLHFGLHRLELVAPLRDAIAGTRPDAVVASGDLSQRARPSQFRQAMSFLRLLALPLLIVPGNHDIPLFNPVLRLFDPFSRYSRHAAQDLTPSLEVGQVRLFGLNSADPFRWRRGIAHADEIERICRAMREGPGDVTNILVSHHPFEEPPNFQRGETRGAAGALGKLAASGLRVILSGHLHHWTVGLGIEDQISREIFHMQTGTALCARDGETDHGFAVLDFDGDRLAVTRWLLDDTGRAFAPRAERQFVMTEGRWAQVAQIGKTGAVAASAGHARSTIRKHDGGR